MAEHDITRPPTGPEHAGEAALPGDMATAQETLAALMSDLAELEAYLVSRGRHTYELAQRFLENARRDSSSRAFDERQATMLEYQHYIWHEIAGQVNKLLVTYGGEPSDEPERAPDAPLDDGHN